MSKPSAQLSSPTQFEILERTSQTSNLNLEKIRKRVYVGAATQTFVLFIPESAYVPGSRTFTQFGEQHIHDARLFELFCILAWRKRLVKVNGKPACVLVVERVTDPLGITKGWLWYLYDNLVAMAPVDETKNQPPVPPYVMSVGEYVEHVMTGVIPGSLSRFEQEKTKFQNLRPDDGEVKDRESPFYWWPRVREIRRYPFAYHQACAYYLSDMTDRSWDLDVSNFGNDNSPSRVFTMENAIDRMKREFHHENLNWREFCDATRAPGLHIHIPYRPREACEVPVKNYLPSVMSTIVRPMGPFEVDPQSNEFKQFHALPANANKSLAQAIEAYEFHLGNTVNRRAEMDMKIFIDKYKGKLRGKPSSIRASVARDAYREWELVWNPCMKEGAAYSAMYQYYSQCVRDGRDGKGFGNFCSAFTAYDETMDVAGNIFFMQLRSIDELKSVASCHRIIILFKTAAFQAASYNPGEDSSKNLVAGVLIGGPPGKGKTHPARLAIKLCIPGRISTW